jgi:hypothetical protein
MVIWRSLVVDERVGCGLNRVYSGTELRVLGKHPANPRLPAIITHVRIICLSIAALALAWSNVTRALNPEEGLSEYKHLVWRSGDQA